MTAQWFPQIDRLTARLTIGITLLVIIPLTGGLYLLSRYQYEHTVAARRRGAELENRILEAALRHQMLRRDPRLMAEIFREVGRQPEVRRAMVVDHSGVVRFSSHEPDIGVRLSQDSPSCLVCHDRAAQERDRWVLLNENGIDILRSVLPIQNRAECHGCHDPKTKLNGILILDVSMSPIQAQVRSDVRRMAMAAALLTLVLIAGIGLHVRYAVLLRLARLGRAARSFAAGMLGERVDVRGDDVISSLSSDFNSMADATSSLIQEVKGREQQIAGVLNSLDDGLVVLDRNFRVVAANRSLARRLCAYPEGLRGRNCRDAIGHALPCREEADCPTARCLSTGTLQRATYRFTSTPEGTVSVHEVYASPVLDDDGTVAQVVEVWRDISERVREEEHLAEIERLSSLGVLASGLSHEVNTPLAVISSYAQMLAKQLQGDEQKSGLLEKITRQSFRASEIVNNLLNFSRTTGTEFSNVSLNKVIADTLALLEHQFRAARITVRDELAPELPPIHGSPGRLQQVFLNLFLNAKDAMAESGGTLTVSTSNGEGVNVTISDTGAGIPPEHMHRIYDPFFTTKAAPREGQGRGTGLGLSVTYGIIQEHAGKIRVESKPGAGTTFYLEFPLVRKAVNV